MEYLFLLVALLVVPILLIIYDIIMCVVTYYEINQNKQASGTNTKKSMRPTCITMKHSLQFMGQKLSYELQVIYAVFYSVRIRLQKLFGVTSVQVTTNDIINFLLNTSLVIYTKIYTREKTLHMALDLKNFCLYLSKSAKNGINDLLIEYEIPITKEDTDRLGDILTFRLNGEDIDDPSAQMSILLMIMAVVIHPQIHSYFDEVYKHRGKDTANDFDDLFIHGQYLNHRAHYYPSYLLDIDPETFLHCLDKNLEIPLPFHNFAGLKRLSSYSRLVSFLLQARRAVKRVCSKYSLPLQPEHLFITSVLHSTDHYTMWKNVEGRFMSVSSMNAIFQPNLHFFAAFVVAPAQNVCTNLLKNKRDKTDAYNELYCGLSEIDKEYADQVTMSISY